jgi:hypothetical protein
VEFGSFKLFLKPLLLKKSIEEKIDTKKFKYEKTIVKNRFSFLKCKL